MRGFNVAGSRPKEAELAHDTNRQRSDNTRRFQCVVVGKSKDSQEDTEKLYYVLLVEPINGIGGSDDVYERVRASFILGKFIARDKPEIRGVIQ
ncbi:hypothetical protein CIB48_g5737 [Xylaria polymorpha]|nr:hypothetical protein CIB48_g5737 [Xylaria polymorpha]